MAYTIVGLGNPGSEYEKTRHNAGRMAVEHVARAYDFDPFVFKKQSQALVSRGEMEGESVVLVLPETYMNRSGSAVSPFVKSLPAPRGTARQAGKKAAHRLIVVHDEIDLPIGTLKIAFGRGSGGHKGVESVARAVKTKEFARIRVGISPAGVKGRAKKPKGEEKVTAFLMKQFTSAEMQKLRRVQKIASDAIQCIIAEGTEKAMNIYNAKR